MNFSSDADLFFPSCIRLFAEMMKVVIKSFYMACALANYSVHNINSSLLPNPIRLHGTAADPVIYFISIFS